MDLDKLIEIRKYLHKNPELSGSEYKTKQFLMDHVKELDPDKIYDNITETGFAALFKGSSPKFTIGFRADIDALPIKESNSFEYKSQNPGVAHLCGHDGHMTNILSLVHYVSGNRDKISNNILFVFQPAEETAQGAKAMTEDEVYQKIKPDYIFGLHNLPGFPLGSVVLRNGVFASASTGLAVNLEGKTSHAGHPENGINPVQAMTNIINGLISIPSFFTGLTDAANITIIHAKLGEVAFGTSPGEATVMATMRSHSDEIMQKMQQKALKIIKANAEAYDLKYSYEWVEHFVTTGNSDKTYNIIKNAAEKSNIEIIEKNDPFPWSEDFGFFDILSEAGFFGIGSGPDHPQLHNPDYDYPDELITVARKMFVKIINYFEQ